MPSTHSLDLLAEFYQTHAAEIETLAAQVTTLDFGTETFTSRHITRAKVIDMFGFERGRHVLAQQESSRAAARRASIEAISG